MTNKIELKELQGYLAYGLQCRHAETGDSNLNIYGASQECIMNGAGNLTLKISEIKPLVIPLSELTDEHKKQLLDADSAHVGNFLYDGGKFSLPLLDKISFNGAQLLMKYHYDVHGWLERGIALSKLDYIKPIEP